MIKKLRQFATNLLIMSKEVFEKVYEAANENRIFEAVYNEYGKLDEMHPKLKALIAAGLIGTAGLGMQSCNMAPDDDPYYGAPTEVSQETPGEKTPEQGAPANQGTPTSEEAGEEKGDEPELSEFEQACEKYFIPLQLGIELKDAISKGKGVSDSLYNLPEGVSISVYEDGKGFVNFDKEKHSNSEGLVVIVQADFYFIPDTCEEVCALFNSAN